MAKLGSRYLLTTLSSYSFMGLNILVQLGLVPFYIQVLGKEAFGSVMLVLAYINFSPIGIGWLSGGAFRKLGALAASGDKGGFQDLLALSKALSLAYACLLAVILLAFQGQIFQSAGLDSRPSLVLGFLAYLFLMYDAAIDRLAMSSQDRQAIANLSQVLALFVFGVSVLGLLLRYPFVDTVLWCQVLGLLVVKLVIFATRIYHRDPVLLWSWARAKRALPELRSFFGPMGRSYFIFGIFTICLQSDAVLLGVLQGPEVVAEFVLVWRLADFTCQVLARLVDSLQPSFLHMEARGQLPELRELYGTVWARILALSAVAALGFAFLGPTILGLWVGSQNAPREPWAYFLAAGGIFWITIARPAVVLAYSLAKMRGLLLAAGADLLLRTVLVFLLADRVGMLAPLIALNVAHACFVFFLYQRVGALALYPGVSGLFGVLSRSR